MSVFKFNMFKMRHLYINLGVLFFSLFLFPSEIHAQTGSGSMMIIGDFDASQFKNHTFNLIPSPVARNYGTRVAIDTSRLSVTYRYTITEPDSLEATIIDMQTLEIGDRLNRFYSRYGEFRDSIMYENQLDFLRTGNEVGVRPDFKKSEHPVYCDVFTYPGENTRLVSERYGKTDYQYTEEVTPIEWQLSPEQEVILGYNCQKATGTFRGREWQVWFTYDIPYNYGPWKLGGLPGLILKAEDSSGSFVWEAVSLVRPEGCPIYRHSEDVDPVSGTFRHKILQRSRKETAKLLETSWMRPLYMSGQSQELYVNDEKVDTRSLSSGRTWYPRLELE